ncbi:hypothetical protein [Streptomyces sp. NPDC048350]
METSDTDEQQPVTPPTQTGLSPALLARAEAGWQKFLDRWVEVDEEPGR